MEFDELDYYKVQVQILQAQLIAAFDRETKLNLLLNAKESGVSEDASDASA